MMKSLACKPSDVWERNYKMKSKLEKFQYFEYSCILFSETFRLPSFSKQNIFFLQIIMSQILLGLQEKENVFTKMK